MYQNDHENPDWIMNINNYGADQELDNYKDIEVGETYMLENPVQIPEDQRPSPDEEWLHRGDEGEVIEIDDDDFPKKAKMRFTLEEGDEDTPSVFAEVWVEYEDIKADINYDWAGEDSQDDYESDVEYLQSELEEIFGEPPWLLNFAAYNRGWDHHSGALNGQKISTADEFLDRIVPRRTEWYARIYKWEVHEDDENSPMIPGIKAVVSDHDSMGSLYYVQPVKLTAKQREEAYRILREDYIAPKDAKLDEDELAGDMSEGYSVSEAVYAIASYEGWEERRSPWTTLFDMHEGNRFAHIPDTIAIVVAAARVAMADADIMEGLHMVFGVAYQDLDAILEDLDNSQPEIQPYIIMEAGEEEHREGETND